MDDLIEALQIFRSYGEVKFPTHCEHDVMYLYPAVPYEDFSEEHIKRLEQLGFDYNSDGEEGFMSFKYGSC